MDIRHLITLSVHKIFDKDMRVNDCLLSLRCLYNVIKIMTENRIVKFLLKSFSKCLTYDVIIV